MATDFQDDSKLQDLKPRTRFSSRQPTAQPTTEVKVAPAGAKTSKEQISKAFLVADLFDDLASKPENFGCTREQNVTKAREFSSRRGLRSYL